MTRRGRGLRSIGQSIIPQGHLFGETPPNGATFRRYSILRKGNDFSVMLYTGAWSIVCRVTHAKREYLSPVPCPRHLVSLPSAHCKPAVYSRLRPPSTTDGVRRRRGLFFRAERGCVGPQQEGLAGQEPIDRSKVRWNRCRSACRSSGVLGAERRCYDGASTAVNTYCSSVQL